MSIAFDAASGNFVNPGASLTVSHTCTGANRALVATVIGDPTSDLVTGVTYAGTAMTLVRKGRAASGRWAYSFYLSAPATGANNIVVSASSSIYLEVDATSYTGVSQSGQPEASSVVAGADTAASYTLTLTTLTANAWLVGSWLTTAGTASAGAGTTLRFNALVGATADSGAPITSPGSASIIVNQLNASAPIGGTVMSLAPAGSGTVTITDPPDFRVYQRSGTTGSTTVGGTYTGTPTNVQVRVVQYVGGAAVTSFVNATAGGGTWSATITGIPQGGWYAWQAQFSNDTAVNATGAAHWGVGCLVGVIGQSELVHADTDGTAVTPNALLAQYTGSAGTAWSQRTNTGNGLNTIGNALIAALGGAIPVALLKYAVGSTALDVAANAGSGYWMDTTAGQPYALFIAGGNSVGGKLEAAVWDQGQQDGFSAAVSQATYDSDLQTLFGRIRTAFSQPSLPIVVVPLGNYSAASSPITDASWEGVRQAQIAVGQGASNTLASAMQDIALVDGAHYTAAAFITYGDRVGQALSASLGLTANARGPAIVSATQTGPTTLVINLTQRGGTDFTPTSGITGFAISSGAGVATITGAVRTSATKVTLTTSAAMTGTITLTYQYGRVPTVTAPLLDNSANALSAMIESGSPLTAIVLATAAAGVLTTNGSTPAASLTGLRWALFDQVTPDALLAPSAKGSGATTNGTGQFSVSIVGTTLAAGAVGFFIIDNTDGTTGTDFKGYAGPLQVS